MNTKTTLLLLTIICMVLGTNSCELSCEQPENQSIVGIEPVNTLSTWLAQQSKLYFPGTEFILWEKINGEKE
ncbi:MAG: hypothetical protein LBH16_06805 [Treponema sp.]|jgi:hypothetical protein|nr:hypothetical protein [Treponema sp.]